ncbi:MAG: hypothetical protein H3C38_14485 [Rhodospirillales bacterium]|nr:hypothetical protein [Rhodospirillales bacterium]
MIIIDSRGTHGDLASEIDRLQSLLDDLRALARGSLPAAERLAAAPVLHDYRLATRAVACLIGKVENHPRCRGPVVTSDLWVAAPDRGFVRTLSRFYRLGRPLEPDLPSF